MTHTERATTGPSGPVASDGSQPVACTAKRGVKRSASASPTMRAVSWENVAMNTASHEASRSWVTGPVKDVSPEL